MYDLFNPPPDESASQLESETKLIVNNISKVPGLIYVSNFIDTKEVKSFIDLINAQTWLSDIKRRVQHYGYKYDYKARNIDYSMFIGRLPNWMILLANRLYEKKYINAIPDQVIVNEYLPGQGIANHIDCEPCFGDTIISISLGCSCVMDFINIETKEKIEIMLESGSMVALRGDARYKWSHGIAQRKSDNFNGVKTDRQLRLSMTFRKVILK